MKYFFNAFLIFGVLVCGNFLLTHAWEEGTATNPVAADLEKLFAQENGSIKIPAGVYYLDHTLEMNLSQRGRIKISGDGPVRIIMKGIGPAIRIKGSIAGTASPHTIKPECWNENMPVISGLEIVGSNPEADGIELVQTLQPVISQVVIRETRHGIMLRNRNRNVIISDCHIYNCKGKGIFLDHVNLHQINISNSHISYNQEGGLVVEGGNVRNIQVTGCDLEANMPADSTPTTTANILINQSVREESIAEVAITGCTIQHSAHYAKTKLAPGGANIRIIGIKDSPEVPNMINITGNVMSDTSCHIHLQNVHDVTITGNNFFTTEPTDLLVEESERVVLSNCVFNPRESSGTGEIIFRKSNSCIINGITTKNLLARNSALFLDVCQEIKIVQSIITGSRNGVELNECIACSVTDCQISQLNENGGGVVGNLKMNYVRDNNTQYNVTKTYD